MNNIKVFQQLGMHIPEGDYKSLYEFMIINRSSEETILRYGYDILKQVVKQDSLEAYIKWLGERSINQKGADSVVFRILDACVSNYIILDYEKLLYLLMRIGFKKCFDFLVIEGIDHRETWQQVLGMAVERNAKPFMNDFIKTFLAQKIELTTRKKNGEDVILPLTREPKRIAFIRAARLYGLEGDRLRQMISENKYMYLLERAIIQDRTDVAEDIIMSSICYNDEFNSLYIVRAVEYGRNEIMKMLMKSGIRPIAKRTDGDYCLTIATMNHNVEMIDCMIGGSGRALNPRTDREAFLQATDRAYALGYFDVFERLCKAGVKGEMILYGNTNDSLLIRAVRERKHKAVEILVRTGSDIYWENKEGKMAIDYANGDEEMCAFLSES
jgi:hypothetical protein